MNISQKAFDCISNAERLLCDEFFRIDALEQVNTEKIVSCFRYKQVASRHFAQSTGYGYDDVGRKTLEDIFARLFGAEAALVRPQFASGTHALAVCLFGLLKPGDHLLSATGKPYDTLEEVIGIRGREQGSLIEWGVQYSEVELSFSGEAIQIEAICNALKSNTKVVFMQRSRGYTWRRAFSVSELEAATKAIHALRPDIIVMVDNCYGEFTEIYEPTEKGINIMAGSLIKNPGGGIAPTGGYIVGEKVLVERAACRLTAPGIGGEVGSHSAGYQAFYQGLFMAPHIVAQALKGAIMAAAVFKAQGFDVSPEPGEYRTDIIQAIKLKSKVRLIAFCEGIQSVSPVDSHVIPVPWDMPGYDNPVIMAAGTFIQGASIELSADAPIKPPYIVYLQGGLTYSHIRLGVASALSRVLAINEPYKL